LCRRIKAREPFAFAGLWEWWRAKDAHQDAPGLETFTILTTEPNELCAPIHNRMPVILARDDWGGWLGSVENRKELLRPFRADRMECWPVGKAVGNFRNEGVELIQRISA
jgi:putative SOS response-associated peptidase YedK